MENGIKHLNTDYKCFLEKYNNSGVKIIEPLLQPLKFVEGDKLKKFGTIHLWNPDYDRFLDPNIDHHLYTNKELCDFAIDIFSYLNVPVNVYFV